MNDIAAFLFSPWGWLSLAAITASLELLAPGIYLIWVALAAFLTALTVAVLNLTLDGQLGIFAIWIMLSLLAAKRWNPGRTGRNDDPLLNQRGARLIGSRVVVTTAIENGRGRVRLGDGDWIAEGPDTPAGQEMRVVATDGTILKVAPDPDPR